LSTDLEEVWDAGYFGVPAIGDPGRAALELTAGRPSDADGSADHELSACSFPGVEVRAASVRGLMHRYRGEPRQDRFSLVHDEASGRLVVAVCDGVGEFSLSHEAAAFAALRMPRAYLTHGTWPKVLTEVNDQLDQLARDAASTAPEGSEPHTFGMATTFVGLAVPAEPNPGTASIAWTDDSSVWLLRDNEWTELTADPVPPDGKVHRTSVRALPHREPRLRFGETPVDRCALFVMTDGVGVPLEGSARVRETLARWWSSPPDVFTFARQVGFARKGHMDDRTVVGIWFGEHGVIPR
jgi:serine/threonine protein phosphatase PrpC